MEVDSSVVQSLVSDGRHIAIVEKTSRDPMMLSDSMNDEYATWAVNHGSAAVCLGDQDFTGHVGDRWRIEPGQEVKLWNGRRVGAAWSLWNASADPQCSRR